MSKLSDQVDWHYVLREFWNLYRFSSAGGSKPIRSHQWEVRNRLSAEMEGDLPVLARESETRPVCAWLGRALDQGLLERTAPLVRENLNQLLCGARYMRLSLNKESSDGDLAPGRLQE